MTISIFQSSGTELGKLRLSLSTENHFYYFAFIVLCYTSLKQLQQMSRKMRYGINHFQIEC